MNELNPVYRQHWMYFIESTIFIIYYYSLVFIHNEWTMWFKILYIHLNKWMNTCQQFVFIKILNESHVCSEKRINWVL